MNEETQKQALSVLGKLSTGWTAGRYKVSNIDMSETEINEGRITDHPHNLFLVLVFCDQMKAIWPVI